ncbi:TPA: sigma-70 family RNA polymerase sigma factor [Clostridioides difficile]|nr:sigma-70 family RNA polymerase sigma factor [Clostridioides difficile]
MIDISEKIKDMQNGKYESFNYIYKEYYIKIFILCKSILKNEEDAGDATQETFIKVYKNIAGLNDIEKFNGWIKKIAINQCIMLIRKNKKINDNYYLDNEEKTLILKDEFNLEENIIEKEKKEIVLEIIDRLSDKKKIVITLFYFNDLKINDIAEVLNISEGTVKSRLNSAKKDLAKYIDEYEEKHTKVYSLNLPIIILLFKMMYKDVVIDYKQFNAFRKTNSSGIINKDINRFSIKKYKINKSTKRQINSRSAINTLSNIIFMLCLTSLVIIFINNPQDKSNELEQYKYVHGYPEQIIIPGYDDIKINTEEKILKIQLLNPLKNQCYFEYEIVIDNTIIYKTRFILPGKVIYNVELDKSLDEGIYDLELKINTYSLQDARVRMNGAVVKTKLIVEPKVFK